MYFFLTLLVRMVQNLSVIVNFNWIGKTTLSLLLREISGHTVCAPGFQLNGLITLFDEDGS